MHKKLTDKDIKNGLECCGEERYCHACPFAEHKAFCMYELHCKTLDLINRQKAEIERYKKTVGELVISKDGETTILLNNHKTEYIAKDLHKTFMNMARNEAKAEAIKEFAERLKDVPSIIIAGQEHYVIVKTYLENLVKEMVGE